MRIGTKLAAAMKKCRYMPKDGLNCSQKYKYTTAASVLAKVNEALAEQDLYVSTKAELLDLREVTTNRGTTEKFAVVKIAVTIHDTDNLEHSITFEGIGSGQDAGDKAVMKSTTAALKYAYIGGLNIAMSDDPEEDSNTDAYYTPTKVKTFSNMETETADGKLNNVVQSAPAKQAKNISGDIAGKCDKCGKAVTAKVAEYSQKNFGQRLCYTCQSEIKGNENPF